LPPLCRRFIEGRLFGFGRVLLDRFMGVFPAHLFSTVWPPLREKPREIWSMNAEHAHRLFPVSKTSAEHSIPRMRWVSAFGSPLCAANVDGAVHERMRPALCDEGVLKLRRVVPISMGLFDRAGDFAKDAATHSRLGVRSLEGFEFDSGSSPATQVASCAVRGPKLQGDYCTAAAA